MEIAEFFERMLVANERMATALERIAEGGTVTNVAQVGDLSVVTVEKSAAAEKTETKKAEKAETKKAEKAETKKAEKAETKKAEEKREEKAADMGVTHTAEDVRKALMAFAGREGTPAAVELLKKHGAASVSALDASKYGDVIADCEAA